MEQKYNILNSTAQTETSAVSRENARLREEIKRLFDYVNQTEKSLESAQNKCSSIENEFQKIQNQLSSEKEKSKSYELKIKSAVAEIELHKKNLTELKTQTENLKVNAEARLQHLKLKASEQISKTQAQVRSQEEQIQSLVQEIKYRESLIGEIKNESETQRVNLLKRIHEFSNENSKLQSHIRQIEQNLSTESDIAKTESQQLHLQLSHLKKELEESLKQVEVEIAGKLILEKRNTSLETKNTQLETRLNALRIEIDRLKKYEANEHQIRQLSAELKIRNKDLTELQSSLEELKSNAQKESDAYKYQIVSLQAQLRSLAQKNTTIDDSLSRFRRYQSRIKKWVRPLLSELKEQIANERRKVQHHLHETTAIKSELDRLTLRLQSEVESSSKREADLRNQYNAIVVSYENRLKTLQSQSESTIELLRRQLIDLQNLFDDQKLNSEIRSDKLQDQIRDLLEQKLKSQTELTENIDYCKILESEITTLKKTINDSQETQSKLNRQIAQIESERDKYKTKLTVELDEYAQVTAKLRTINLQRAEEIKKLQDAYATSEKMARQLELEKNQLREQIEGMNTLWQKALTELESKTLDQKQVRKINQKLVDELRSRTDAIQGLKARNAKLQGEVQKLSLTPKLGNLEFDDNTKTGVSSGLPDFEDDHSGEIST